MILHGINIDYEIMTNKKDNFKKRINYIPRARVGDSRVKKII